jgi:hypothetical protein
MFNTVTIIYGTVPGAVSGDFERVGKQARME